MKPDFRRAALISAVLLALTLLGFFYIPGHTYLQSDTQIYIPLFERMEHPNLFNRDFLTATAHIGLTIYDETAIGLQRLTQADFETVLTAEQLVFRALGLLGVFLIAASLGLTDGAALTAAAVYGLGAAIVGPAVLSVEYEPVPRGFAVPMLLLATGLVLNERPTWACAAASVGFLYHSPSTIPFWILFAATSVVTRRIRPWWPLAVASLVLATTFLLQRGILPPTSFLTRIDPPWEEIIRMRTAYDWISAWPSGSVLSFAVFCLLALLAVWRIRALTTTLHRVFLIGFPSLGVASIAASWLLLDQGKWALMAQVQPARAALFTVVFAQINCAVAAVLALRDRRFFEGYCWFIPVFVPACNVLPVSLFPLEQAAVVLLLALAASALTSVPRVEWLAAPAVTVLACWAIPHVAHVSNYPQLHSPQLDQLSAWARSSTNDQALFVFPKSGHSLEQGVFRVKAVRSLYADWKSGGQVNYFRPFAIEWRRRWMDLSSGNLSAEDWRVRGVDYVIQTGSRTEPLNSPVFDNTRYRVYKIR